MRRIATKNITREEYDALPEDEKKKYVLIGPRRTVYGGPDMPKRQLCPTCGALAKRTQKTERGATYWCWCGTTNSLERKTSKRRVKCQ